MDNSAFISYRRNISGFPARAVFQNLRANGIDVFLDIESIDSGHFESVILNQIAARPYFILLLAPGSLERCDEPDDWLRREIEAAIDLERVIVPLLTSGFDFNAPYARPFLIGKLEQLTKFNALNVPLDYFEEAMARLRTRFLKPVALLVTPAPDQSAAQAKIELAAAEPSVTDQQLTAQRYFERALARSSEDFEGQIADYSEAIRLNSELVEAYFYRSIARKALGDDEGAAEDYRQYAYSKGIGLKPKEAAKHNSRGVLRFNKGDLDGAIAEFSEAIRLNPRFTTAFSNRADVLREKGDIEGALSDYSQAIDLDATYWHALYGRGSIYASRGDTSRAQIEQLRRDVLFMRAGAIP